MYIGYLQRGQLWWYYEKNLFLRHGSQNEWPHTNVTGCNSVYKHIGQSNIFILNNWANEYFKNKIKIIMGTICQKTDTVI